MLESLATSSFVAWPLALTLATVVVSDRFRTRRRRELANRALHELRRPLQALTLAWPQPTRGGRDHLGLALSALGELDRSINGSDGPAAMRVELIDAHTLAADAVRRWRRLATSSGREISLRWRANGSLLVCDRDALARALDNLIANALEHGGGKILVDGSVREGRLRLTVADAGAGDSPLAMPSLRSRSVRRGHGLRIVAEIAADHGGRFAACAHGRGAQAVIEIPLASGARAAAG
jgi:two-component system sensor histidine kinase FlrB